MVDILTMVDLTSISALLAATGVLVGVVFAILELRNLTRTRQTDLVHRIYSTFGSKEKLEQNYKLVDMEFSDYDDFVKKGYSTGQINELFMIFEELGLLLHRKLVDIGLVDDLFGSYIKMAWEKIEPAAAGQRKEHNIPELYEWAEYLYNEMQKREQRLQQIQQ